MPLDHLERVRAASQLLDLEARVHLHRHNLAAATESLICELRLAETLRAEPLLVSQMVRVAIFHKSLERIYEFLEQGQPQESDLAKLQSVLHEIDFPGSLTRALQGERAIIYETCTSDTKSMQQVVGSVPALDWAPQEQLITEMRPGDVSMVLTLLTEAVEASKHPFPKAADEATLVDARRTQFFSHDSTKLSWNRHVLSQMLLPPLGTMFEKTQGNAARQRELVTRLAVERFRFKRGKLPETLDVLVPELLKAIPQDPYNGLPLKIAITGDEYSIASSGDAANTDGREVPSQP